MARLLEKKAKEAFIDDDFILAVNLYSQAIYSDPNNADLFADRAQAYIKLDNLPGCSHSLRLSLYFSDFFSLLLFVS
ncbi:hypothetical protein L6164_028274 [Bauhinia variegata]|uniref:Uncharacterized protein n=1 Tax=Bauhinia variegata TaxID=167791 RepID=A0ACB9LX31_BAUVA|nr:hypothetical protein L6164_028274 [Bauhinia variegata]